MTPLHYRMSFVAPAFVGDADQSARWRTPAIKAQLRQWWRVAFAAGCGHRVDVDRMRTDEAWLFGAAGDGEGQSGRSRVRLRLDRWDAGALAKKDWKPLPGVMHKEVQRQVAADLYLGYGPVTLPKGQLPTLKTNAAIQAGEDARLSIGLTSEVDEANANRLRLALHLMDRLGTLGGRSRNGWGSYVLDPLDDTPAWPAMLDASVLRPWRDALRLDWTHALGSDDRGPLVWSTGAKDDWRAAMVELARLKIALRVELLQCGLEPDPSLGDRQLYRGGRPDGVEHGLPRPRHWLAYPVTHHDVKAWKSHELRLPNTLRFKLRPAASAKVEGVVFQMPALPPPAFEPQRHADAILDLWQRVHAELDRRLHPADGRKARR